MLPRTVADKLKLGQSVEPESFESVTIFFSDVVGFTVIASKCSPIQVVNFLNDLYSTFDTIIDENNCFKVETIGKSESSAFWITLNPCFSGDAYLCVSGLPIRNGNRHAADIAEMSFGFLRAIKNFKIAHLPHEKIIIRIGLHTGMNPPTQNQNLEIHFPTFQVHAWLELWDLQCQGRFTLVFWTMDSETIFYRFCLFGDTVNTASRMESNGKREFYYL